MISEKKCIHQATGIFRFLTEFEMVPEMESNKTEDTLRENIAQHAEQEWPTTHFLTFSFSVLCTLWVICSNIVILSCFIRNRKRHWSDFSRQVCSMSVGDLFVALNISFNLTLERIGQAMNGIICFQALYFYFTFKCVTLYHVLGICIYRNIKLQTVAEPVNDAKHKLHSNVVIVTSWISALVVVLVPFILWSDNMNRDMICHASELFGSNLQKAMMYLSFAFFIPQCLTNVIYLTTCYRFLRAIQRVRPVENNAVLTPIASTSGLSKYSDKNLCKDDVRSRKQTDENPMRNTAKNNDGRIHGVLEDFRTKPSLMKINSERSLVIGNQPFKYFERCDVKQDVVSKTRNATTGDAHGYNGKESTSSFIDKPNIKHAGKLHRKQVSINSVGAIRTKKSSTSVEKPNTSTVQGKGKSNSTSCPEIITAVTSTDNGGRQTISSQNPSQNRSTSTRAYYKRVIGTIGLLLLFFNIFTLPITLAIFFEPSQSTPHDVKVITGMMFVMNSGINAIVYVTRVPSLRKDIISIFSKCGRFRRRGI